MGTEEERNWAMCVHLASLSGILALYIGFFVGPLVVWLLGRETRPSLTDHMKEVVNFFITWTIVIGVLVVIGFLLTLLTLGIGAIIVVPLAWLLGIVFFVGAIIFPIIGAIKAREGIVYRYPLTLRLL